MNFGDLERALSESLTWRKHELQQARFLAEEASDANKHYLCRAWTLVMYAHCDQYVKELSRLYLSYLKSNPRNSYDYWSIWQAFRSKELMLNASDGLNFDCVIKPKNNKKTDLVDVISHKTVLDSGSFKYERLRFITNFILQIEFDCAEYKGFCTTLKVKRDQIAHGERSYIEDVSDCVDWHDPTISLLNSLTESVLKVSALD